MQHYCKICKNWCEDEHMHNENYCANCHLDRFLGEVEIEDTSVYVFANESNLQFIMAVSIDNLPQNVKQKLTEALADFDKVDDTVICSGCDKQVSFNDAIIVTLNGQMLTICDYDCYLKLKGEIHHA